MKQAYDLMHPSPAAALRTGQLQMAGHIQTHSAQVTKQMVLPASGQPSSPIATPMAVVVMHDRATAVHRFGK